MAVNVTGTTGYVGPRSLCATSTGRLWQLTGSGTTLQMWYSDDSGATWTHNTAADITGSYGQGHADLFIDADDHAHLVRVNDVFSAVMYHRMASIGTGTSWSSTTTVRGGTDMTNPRVVAHREGTGWKAHVIYELGADFGYGPVYGVEYNMVSISSGGALTAGTAHSLSGWLFNMPYAFGIDFHHTQADIKAVQGGTPHLYAAWYEYSHQLKFAKATYSGGAWSWGTARLISAGLAATPNTVCGLIFDGTRVVMAAQTGTSTPTVTIYERDSVDSATTTRTMTSMTIVRPNLTYNEANQDITVIGENAAGTSVDYRTYSRATDTWGAQTAIEAEAVTHNTVAVRRGGAYVFDAAWDAASSIRFERTTIPSPPTAPTWVYGEAYGPEDVGASLLLWWEFHDPLPGDTQSAYALRRQIGSGTVHYWRALDSSWQTTEAQNAFTGDEFWLSAGWGADGDADHKYAVKTWDAAGTPGVYSAEQTITPSVPVPATLTTPTDGATIGVANLTAAWTCSEQTGWRLFLTEPGGSVTLWDSGDTYEPSTRAAAVDYVLQNGDSYDLYLHTLNAEGLSAIVHALAFDVVYTAPATPTLTVVADSAAGKITVTPTHPTPTGDQPTVTTIDIFVRCAGGTYPAGERPVGGAGIRVVAGSAAVSAPWIDWACPSGRAMEYRVRGWAANGTYTDSAWTA